MAQLKPAVRFYGSIRRVDEEQRMVYGYAGTEARATDGMTITRDALSAALDDYMRFANVREMHQKSAVGVARDASVDDNGLYIGAHVVDDVAWGKVKAGVYKGFSIGGSVTRRDATDKTIVRGLTINEISLVDRPSDPGATFDVWRRMAGPPDLAALQASLCEFDRLEADITRLSAQPHADRAKLAEAKRTIERGRGMVFQALAPTDDQVRAAFESMSPADRAMAMTRAALARPMSL